MEVNIKKQIKYIAEECVKKILERNRFCKKCEHNFLFEITIDDIIKNFGIYCKKCESYFPLNPKEIGDERYLAIYHELLEKEKEKIFDIKEIKEKIIKAKVLDFLDDTVELIVEKPLLNEGDYVHIVIKKDNKWSSKFFGIVLIKDEERLIIKYDPKKIKLNKDEKINIIESDFSFAYDLQIEKIEEEIKRRIDYNEISFPFEIILGNLTFNEIDKIEELNEDEKYETKGRFKLDETKQEILKAILKLKQREILLIVGPPGTGKTTLISKASDILAKKGEKVLITSHTNKAVDNAIELLEKSIDYTLRVGVAGKISKNVEKFTLMYKINQAVGEEFKKLNEEIKKLIKRKIKVKKELKELIKAIKDLKPYEKEGFEKRIKLRKDEEKAIKQSLIEKIEKKWEIMKKESERLIKEAKIIGATLIKSSLNPLEKTHFDTVIIDEASQCSLSLALLGIVKGDKWILIGDHKQLLPIFRIIKNYKVNEELGIFSKLFKLYNNRTMWIYEHYRSNPKIIKFSNKLFYDNKLIIKTKENERQIKIEKFKSEFLNPKLAFVFLDINSEQKAKGKSYYNEEENELIVNILKELKKFNYKEEIGIISPYRAQRDILTGKIKEENVEINTVDGFQGKEKDLILFSITATESNQLKFAGNPNRINVAITRAKKKIIIIGNSEKVIENKFFKEIINYSKENGGYFKLQ